MRTTAMSDDFLTDFKYLHDFIAYSNKHGLNVIALGRTDPEDDHNHYFAGTGEQLDHFRQTGGELIGHCGYFCEQQMQSSDDDSYGVVRRK